MRFNAHARHLVFLARMSLAIVLCGMVSGVERCFGAVTGRSGEARATTSPSWMLEVRLPTDITRTRPATWWCNVSLPDV